MSRREYRAGDRLGRYVLGTALGRGASGEVFEARDPELQRTVAIKVLHDELTRGAGQRLRREALALARISHPNVVQIHEIDEARGCTFIAMELVRGQTLDQWRLRNPPWRRCIEVYRQAGAGLAAAHAEGIVHRDFKPHNCILGDDGRVRVLDFGLARDPQGLSPTSELPLEQRADEPLTSTGAIVGTPAYMPLEQFDGKPAVPASDQFSFCVSLFEAIYGARPFEGGTVGSLVVELRKGAARFPSRPRVPRALRRVLLRGLSASTEDRWPSMDRVLAELSRVDRHARVRGAGALIVGGLALSYSLGSWFGTGAEGHDPCADPGEALEGTWGPKDRATVAAAFDRSADPMASANLARIEERLDAYARDWVAMYEETCRATFVSRQQSEQLFDRRMRCLQHRRNRLRAAIDAFVEAEDEEVLVRQLIVPYRLPPVAECADVEALGSEQPLPADPEVRARIANLRERLDRADTFHDAGAFAEGIEVASAVVREARGVSYGPVLAEALASLGRLQSQGASAQEAEETLREAVMLASELDLDHVEASAWVSMMFVMTRQRRINESSLELAARAAVGASGDPTLRGWFLNNLGVFRAESGEVDAALELFRQAIDVKADHLGDDHVDVGVSWLNFANALADQERYREASEALAKARAIFENTIGDSHPMTYYALSGMCRLEQAQGDPELAVTLCRDVLQHFEKVSASSMWQGRTGFILAQALWRVGQRVEAREVATRAREHAAADEDSMTSKLITMWLEDPSAPIPTMIEEDCEGEDCEDGEESSDDEAPQVVGDRLIDIEPETSAETRQDAVGRREDSVATATGADR